MKPLTFKNVQYGQLVVYHQKDGYHSGVKVHFFNKRGVFIGNFYRFVNYSELSLRDHSQYERVFYKRPMESIRQFVYVSFCKVTTLFIRTTQKWSA